MGMPQGDCPFCPLLEGEQVNAAGHVLLKEDSLLVLWRSQNFAVVMDIAPITSGHCLIVPFTHVSALASLREPERRELSFVSARVREVIAEAYGTSMCCFEHGIPATEQSTACCVDHAHMHVIPCPIDVSKRIVGDGFQPIQEGYYADVGNCLSGRRYLYYGAHGGRGAFYDAKKMPSQYLRRVLCEELSVEVWNWHDAVLLGATIHQKPELLLDYEKLRSRFSRAESDTAARMM